MTDDEFQAYATREAAMAIGEWLIDAKVLEKPVQALRRHELEAMAAAAISRFMVLTAEEMAKGRPLLPEVILFGG